MNKITTKFKNIQFISQTQNEFIINLKVKLKKKKDNMTNFQKIMANNKKWSQDNLKQDPQYFIKNLYSQTPQYLWIGCSDSRIPAQSVLGLKPGELFVHRNIANQVPLSDINTLSVIQYAVQVLQVRDIIVAGHYSCGGIKAAFKKQDHGALESWLAHIRDIRIRFRHLLTKGQQENENLLVQLNVKSQVYDIAKIPSVQKAWIQGKQLRIHGLVYQMENGILKDLGLTLSKLSMIPEQFWIYDNKMAVEIKEQFKKSHPVSAQKIESQQMFQNQEEVVVVQEFA